MEKYQQYVNSGFDWVGEIPAQWNNMRLRFVCEFRNGYTPSKANPDFWQDGIIPWYRMEDIRDTGRKLNEAKQYVTKDAIKGGGLFEAGSFILATTATIGEHAVLIVDSLANQQFTNLKIRKSLSHSLLRDYFFYYLFVIDDYCKATTKTSTFPAVSMELLKNCHVVFPSLQEQMAIISYLDKKCSEIDKVISAQQKRIALLQELKQSVITHAVTKGLDPNVKMKDSGVEWIGEVPSHWEVVHLKQALKSFQDGTHGTYKNVDHGRVLLSAKNVTEQGLVIGENERIISEEDYSEIVSNGFPKKGDVLLCCVGTIGRCCIFVEPAPVAFQRSVTFLRTNKRLLNKMLLFILKNQYVVTQLNLFAKTSAQSGVYMGDLVNFHIAVPPLLEQQMIVDYLDKKCFEIDSSISKAQHQVELLQEYKQSLITEVVTGKRKVL